MTICITKNIIYPGVPVFSYTKFVSKISFAIGTSDPETITMSLRYDNAIQTPQGTGIGTTVARTIGTLSTGGGH